MNNNVKISPSLNFILSHEIFEIANKFKHQHVTPQDIAYCLITNSSCKSHNILREMGVNIKDLSNEIINYSSYLYEYFEIENLKKSNILKTSQHIINLGEKIYIKLKSDEFSTEHLILAFLIYRGVSESINSIRSILKKYGINTNDFMEKMKGKEENKKEDEKIQEQTIKDKKAEIKEELGLRQSGFIDNVNNFVSKNKEGIIGREKEIERCIQILCRKKKKNLIIVGESGTGKTSLVYGIVEKILNKNVPKQLIGAEVFSVDIGGIVSGTKYRGQFEERMKVVMNFIINKNKGRKSSIMFIDEIHSIIGAGNAEGSIDASGMLKPKLSTGEIQCIGTTTYNEYRRYFKKDDALSRRFSVIFLEEPSVEETLSILKGIKREYEDYHNVNISNEVLDEIVKLSDKYIKNRHFPDKAIDVLDEACARFLINLENIGKEKYSPNKNILPLEIVFETISEITRIPILSMTLNEKSMINDLESRMKEKIIGQDHAVKIVSNSIKRSRSGLKDINAPISVLLFLGTTGTGKTLVAQTLSEQVFGNNKIIRLDMSEYMEKFSVNKIIGSPPGYIGYDDGGQLAERVRQNPYSVILLDEIEKANKDVLNIFLQVFDEGRLTDSYGSYIDFRNTIIIMTSNISASKLDSQKKLGFNIVSDIEEQNDINNFLNNEAKKYFTPEFYNRIDEIVVFNKLNNEDMVSILDIEINKIKEKMKDKGYSLSININAKKHLIDKISCSKYGARPLKNLLRKEVEEPIASLVFSDNFSKGDIVYVGKKKECSSLSFSIRKAGKNKNGKPNI